MKHKFPIAIVIIATGWVAFMLIVRNRPNATDPSLPVTDASTKSASDSAVLIDPRATDAKREDLAAPPSVFRHMARWGAAPIRLSVVEFDSDRPIPGASVSFIESDDTHRDFVGDTADSFSPDPEAYLREHGRSVIADAHGEVDVPTGSRSTYVCGRKDDRFGWKRFEPHEAGDRRLELEHQDELSVRVVDDADKGRAGVPVCISNCDDDRAMMRLLTDDDGRVRIRNFTSNLREMMLIDQRVFEVRVDQVAVPRVMCWIDPRHVPKETVVLKLPASATLDVEVVDANGMPCHRAGKLSMRPAPAPGTENDPPRGPTLWAHIDSEDVASTLVPAPIGVDLLVIVECDCGGWTSGTATGARSAGEHVPLRLTLRPDSSCITGRAVDSDGAVMAKRRLRLCSFSHTNGGGLSCSNDPLLTDKDGRFVMTMRSTEEWIIDSINTQHAHGARLETAGWPKTGSFDLGDVKLAPIEPLVHGHVEDASGARLAGAYVQLGIQHTGVFKNVEHLISAGPTDITGEFTFYIPHVDGALVVSAATEGGGFRLRPSNQPVALDPPGNELILRLEALGELEGTLLLDDASQFGLIQVQLSDEEHVYPQRIIVGHEMRFRFEGVSVGMHKLTVWNAGNNLRSSDSATILSVVDGIEVRVGEVTRDPRLQPLDLRTKLPFMIVREVEFSVVDATGASVPFGKSWLWSAQPGLIDTNPWSTGRVHVPTEGVDSIDVWANGMRVSHALVHDLHDAIMLRPECDVSLVLDQVHGLVAAGHRVLVTLNPTADDQRTKVLRETLRQFHVSSFVDSTGEARFHFAVPGQFGMHIEFMRIDPLTNTVEDKRIVEPQVASGRIEVRDQDGPLRFDVHFDAKDIAEVESSFQAH